MLTYEIKVFPERCSGCLLCMIACNFFFTKAFGLGSSRIDIHRINGKDNYTIKLLDSCTRCGLCVKYCYYSALVRVCI